MHCSPQTRLVPRTRWAFMLIAVMATTLPFSASFAEEPNSSSAPPHEGALYPDPPYHLYPGNIVMESEDTDDFDLEIRVNRALNFIAHEIRAGDPRLNKVDAPDSPPGQVPEQVLEFGTDLTGVEISVRDQSDEADINIISMLVDAVYEQAETRKNLKSLLGLSVRTTINQSTSAVGSERVEWLAALALFSGFVDPNTAGLPSTGLVKDMFGAIIMVSLDNLVSLDGRETAAESVTALDLSISNGANTVTSVLNSQSVLELKPGLAMDSGPITGVNVGLKYSPHPDHDVRMESYTGLRLGIPSILDTLSSPADPDFIPSMSGFVQKGYGIFIEGDSSIPASEYVGIRSEAPVEISSNLFAEGVVRSGSFPGWTPQYIELSSTAGGVYNPGLSATEGMDYQSGALWLTMGKWRVQPGLDVVGRFTAGTSQSDHHEFQGTVEADTFQGGYRNRVLDFPPNSGISASDSGSTITNANASGLIWVTLPPAQQGIEFEFVRIANFPLIISSMSSPGAQFRRAGEGTGLYTAILQEQYATISIRAVSNDQWVVTSELGLVVYEGP